MTYEQTLQYLFTHLPMFSKIGADAYKKDITNTAVLCEFLGNPQNKVRTIHIAGTNGKGSTSHMLAAVFQQSGYKTGLYTSPHLKDFRERFKINGAMIEPAFVVSFVEKIKKLSEEIAPSFFELTVAMMLEYFSEKQVDIAIVETGLGGRLDSTNIITPILSVITNIGYDHMNILGNTLEAIAAEKAGIIKKNIPVVIGEASMQTKPVFLSKAKEQEALITFAEDKYIITGVTIDAENLVVQLKSTQTGLLQNYALDLAGVYQQNNVRTVISALDVLASAGYRLDEKDKHDALARVKQLNGLFGRWDIIQRKPMTVLDVAHNEDGIRQVLSQLSLLQAKALHIVFGIVRDKDASAILALLPKDATYYFTKAQIPRALPEQELLEKAAQHDLHGIAYPEVNMALAAARGNAGKDDLILVCGSVYLVGEVSRP